MARHRPWRRERRHALLVAALLLLVYVVIPVEPDANRTRMVARGVVTVLMVGAVVWVVTRQVRREITADAPTEEQDVRDLVRLADALVAGLLVFALADYLVARTWPAEFTGLETKLDALYFALATLTTIGYGDVTAQGQIARGVVCAQMVFSIGVLATGVSVLVRQLTRRPRR